MGPCDRDVVALQSSTSIAKLIQCQQLFLFESPASSNLPPSCPRSILRPFLQIRTQQPFLLEIRHHRTHRVFDGAFCALDDDLRILRLFVWGRDAGEVLNLAGARFLVQALGVALLGFLERDVDEDLDESQGIVVGLLLARRRVQGPRRVAIGAVGRDECCEHDGAGVGEELGDLWFEGLRLVWID